MHTLLPFKLLLSKHCKIRYEGIKNSFEVMTEFDRLKVEWLFPKCPSAAWAVAVPASLVPSLGAGNWQQRSVGRLSSGGRLGQAQWQKAEQAWHHSVLVLPVVPVGVHAWWCSVQLCWDMGTGMFVVLGLNGHAASRGWSLEFTSTFCLLFLASFW